MMFYFLQNDNYGFDIRQASTCITCLNMFHQTLVTLLPPSVMIGFFQWSLSQNLFSGIVVAATFWEVYYFKF